MTWHETFITKLNQTTFKLKLRIAVPFRFSPGVLLLFLVHISVKFRKFGLVGLL